MSFEKIKNERAKSAQYMADEIATVCNTFGKRGPGSKGEKDAIDYMAEQLKPYTDEVTIEPFDLHPGAFMGWIYFSVTLFFLALALYFLPTARFGKLGPILSLVFIAIGMVLMVGEFVLYRQLIDKLFKKETSHNLLAIKKPTGEVKRRLLYNGHPDAACEWTFNYYFGGVGFVGHFVISMLFLLYLVIILVLKLATNLPAATFAKLGYAALAAIPFWIALYFLWNEKLIVDGANDNLTGCYMGIAVLKALHDAGIELEHTEVGVLLTGSEEAGLRGAKAFCEAHKDDFKDVETIIFAYDTINEGRFLGVNTRDLNNIVKADEHAVNLFKNAADKLGVTCNKISVPLGATDSAAFNQGGFKCVGITAMDHNLQDYYHTRKDTADNLDLVGLADCFAVSVQALEDFENGN